MENYFWSDSLQHNYFLYISIEYEHLFLLGSTRWLNCGVQAEGHQYSMNREEKEAKF